MSSEDGGNSVNFSLFRDCLFNTILDKSNPGQKQRKPKARRLPEVKSSTKALNSVPKVEEPAVVETTSDPSQLVEFSDYLASEVFPSFPSDLRIISHEALQEDGALSDKWSLPLSLSTYEEIVELQPPLVTDSLEAYGLIEPPKSDLQSFLSPVIAAYIASAITPPPKWSATKVTACEICERDWIPLTYHHLIPKAVHAKVLKRGWHDEQQLNSVAWLCRACHSFVHRMASNEELAKEYYTVDKIMEREEVQKFATWVGKVRWKKT